MREVPVSHDTLERLDNKLKELCREQKAECWHDGSQPFHIFGIKTKSKVYTKTYTVYVGKGTIMSIHKIKITLRYNWNIMKGRIDMSSEAWAVFFDKLPELFTEQERSGIIRSDNKIDTVHSLDGHQP